MLKLANQIFKITMINVLTEREKRINKIEDSFKIHASIKIIKMDSLALKIQYVNLGNH